MADPETKKRKTISLKLTSFELLHLRDVLSIALASEMKTTVSQALAKQEQRSLVEAKLWQKVSKACMEAGIPLGDDAPDFVVAASSSPPIGVFELAHEASVQEAEVTTPNILDRLVNEE